MGYPTAAVVFTTKTAGAVVQPAHVNDLQTEVTALEAALLTTGLAHNLFPDGDGTRSVGSSAARFKVYATQLEASSCLMADGIITRPVLKDYGETISTGSLNSSNGIVWNIENGNIHSFSYSSNVSSVVISNPPAAGVCGMITVLARANGSTHTITWPSAVKWSGGTAPNPSSGLDVYTFMTDDAGSTWIGFISGQDHR